VASTWLGDHQGIPSVHHIQKWHIARKYRITFTFTFTWIPASVDRATSPSSTPAGTPVRYPAECTWYVGATSDWVLKEGVPSIWHCVNVIYINVQNVMNESGKDIADMPLICQCAPPLGRVPSLWRVVLALVEDVPHSDRVHPLREEYGWFTYNLSGSGCTLRNLYPQSDRYIYIYTYNGVSRSWKGVL